MTVYDRIDLARRMHLEPAPPKQPEPAFNFDLGRADDYEALLGGLPLASCSEDELWEEAVKSGRVLLVGDGGSGKTSILGRLWRRAQKSGAFACWVDLRRWNELADEKHVMEEDPWNAELMLNHLGVPRATEQELELASPDIQLFVFIDGINEVSSRQAEQLLMTADYLARRHPRLGVVASDRLVRRESISSRWTLARVMAAHTGQVSKEPLLQNAFFLNLALDGQLGSQSASEVVHSYLADHVGLEQDKVLSTAAAAARAYVDHATRSFEAKSFEQRVGTDTFKQLVSDGLVSLTPYAHFSHQLVHDTLAADWLAADESRWAAQWLDTLTFRASSFDALAIALGRIRESESVDKFLRAVYDWSFYGAAFALSRAQQLGDVNVSDAMRFALLTMLAERRWDPVVSTTKRAEDALRLVGGSSASKMLQAKSFEEIHDFVAVQPEGDSAFEQWRQLFLRDRQALPTGDEIALLRDQDSLLGWTAANVLRRTQSTPEAVTEVSRLASFDSADVVRWRAVHVLGAWPSASKTVQERLLNDMNAWVRYGAAGSLIDIAAKKEALRESILKWVTEHLMDLRDPSDRLVGEVERALVRYPVPTGWTESVAELVGELFAQAADSSQRERCRRLAAQLRAAERGKLP